MKQAGDDQTLEPDMPGAKRGRGRPPTGQAMSSAERQKAYRDRKREEKAAIVISRNASQEFPPDDGSPRRLIAELDRAHQMIETLQRENARLADELAQQIKRNALQK
jgi:plasmid stabilization system protein ParE